MDRPPATSKKKNLTNKQQTKKKTTTTTIKTTKNKQSKNQTTKQANVFLRDIVLGLRTVLIFLSTSADKIVSPRVSFSVAKKKESCDPTCFCLYAPLLKQY
jgi:hypothetical protein